MRSVMRAHSLQLLFRPRASEGLHPLVPAGLVSALGLGMLFGALGIGAAAISSMVVAAGLLCLLLWLRQDAIVAVGIVVLSIMVDYYLRPHLAYFPFTATMLALILLGVMLMRGKRGGSTASPWILAQWGLLLLLAAPAILRSDSLAEGIGYYALVFVNAWIMFYVGRRMARDMAHVRRFLKALAAFGTFIAAHTIIVAKTGAFLLGTVNIGKYLADRTDFTLPGSQASRAGSFLYNPDSNGTFLAIMVIIAISLVIGSSSAGAKALFICETGALLVALLFTYSTAAWIGLAVGLLVFVALAGRASYRLYLLAIAAIAGGGMLTVFTSPIDLLLSHATTTNELWLRVAAWQTALNTIRAHFWTGIGLGTTNNYLNQTATFLAPVRYTSRLAPETHPHNSYLEIAAMAGVPVLILFASIGVQALLRALRTCWQASGGERALLSGAIGAIAVASVNSLASNGWTLPPLVVVDWLILGVVASPLLAGSLASSPREDDALVAPLEQTAPVLGAMLGRGTPR